MNDSTTADNLTRQAVALLEQAAEHEERESPRAHVLKASARLIRSRSLRPKLSGGSVRLRMKKPTPLHTKVYLYTLPSGGQRVFEVTLWSDGHLQHDVTYHVLEEGAPRQQGEVRA